MMQIQENEFNLSSYSFRIDEDLYTSNENISTNLIRSDYYGGFANKNFFPGEIISVF